MWTRVKIGDRPMDVREYLTLNSNPRATSTKLVESRAVRLANARYVRRYWDPKRGKLRGFDNIACAPTEVACERAAGHGTGHRASPHSLEPKKGACGSFAF